MSGFKNENLDLSKVHFDLSKEHTWESVGMTKKEVKELSTKVGDSLHKLYTKKEFNFDDFLTEVLPKLTAKEAALILMAGLKSQVEETMDMAEAVWTAGGGPDSKLSKLLVHLAKKEYEADGEE